MKFCLVLAFAVVLASCKPPSAQGRFVEQTQEGIMGTQVQIKIWIEGDVAEEEAAKKAMEQAFSRARKVESLMSPYDPDSAVSRINANAGGDPVKVDEWTWHVIETSVAVSEKTTGSFDPTWAALSGLWDYRAQNPSPPSGDDLEVRLSKVGFEDLQIDPDARSVRLAKPGMRLGLGGSAKGFALDQMAQALREAGAEDFICYAGGDLFVSGAPGRRPWKLGVQHPRKSEALVATYEVDRPMAVVTSGDYERFFIHEGNRYHHILDPFTGFPASGVMSVTLQAPTGLLADALSTGVFVLGVDRGLELVESTDGVEAAIIDARGKFHVSSGLKDVLSVTGSI